MTAAPRAGVTTAARVVTLPCARRWPTSLDGRGVRPILGTWHPRGQRTMRDQDNPTIVPVVSCPRCARPQELIVDSYVATILKRPITHAVDEHGTVAPELRCECQWYGTVVLAEWGRYLTLFAVAFLQGRDPLIRTLYLHAWDVTEARATVAANPARRIIAVSPVIRNDQERLVLL